MTGTRWGGTPPMHKSVDTPPANTAPDTAPDLLDWWLDAGFTEADAHGWRQFFDSPSQAGLYYPHLDPEVAFAWHQGAPLMIHIPTIKALTAAGWTPTDAERVAAATERAHDTLGMWALDPDAHGVAEPGSTESVLLRLAETGRTPQELARALDCGLTPEEIEHLHDSGHWDGDGVAALAALRS